MLRDVFIRIPFTNAGKTMPCRLRGYYIHIGVGSDVVCSILIGNARASNAWNGQQAVCSTSFLCPIARILADINVFEVISLVAVVSASEC